MDWSELRIMGLLIGVLVFDYVVVGVGVWITNL